MTDANKRLLKVSSVLWVIWGLVHLLTGIMILSGDATSGFQAIAGAVPPASLVLDYPAAVSGVLSQHAWNLTWFGIVTIVGAIFIWRQNLTAIWVTAMVGGLADLGYFLFIDLAGFANFVPGTVMTIVSATAILLSGRVWIASRNG